MLLFTELPLSDPWPFFLQGHPESMKIGVGRCHLHVGFPLVPRKKSPTLSVTQEEPCEGTSNCCLRARILDSVLTGFSRWRPYFHTRGVLGNSTAHGSMRRAWATLVIDNEHLSFVNNACS